MFYNKKQLHTVIKKVVNLYVVYEITNFHGIDSYPRLANALFGAVKLTKNADIDKYKYFGYGIGFGGYIYEFSVDYYSTDVDDIKDIHKYLM